MNKKLIRLTEQDLHNIIRESVENILNNIKPQDDWDAKLQPDDDVDVDVFDDEEFDDGEFVDTDTFYKNLKGESIQLAKDKLHKIIKESVNKVLKEDNDRDFGQFGQDQPSLEEMQNNSMIDCTFLIKQNKLIPKPSASVIGNNIPDNDWCSIKVRPQFEHAKDGLYINDLDWEYEEAPQNMQPQLKYRLMKAINNAIGNQFKELCQVIYQTSPYC